MMFLIVTELNARPAAEYPDLERAIKALGNWSNRLKNGWIVESRFNASQIRDLLKPHLVSGQDRIFVARMTKNWAGTGMGDGFQEWMNRRNFDAPK
ncbi:MAG: hypothetical protein ACOZNI_15880 [Myxococcota bacterium]